MYFTGTEGRAGRAERRSKTHKGAVMMRILLGTTMFAGLMVAGAAQAADMPLKAQRAAPAYFYNWSGFYIGGHVGGVWGDKDWLFTGPLTTTSHNVSGFLGGGQVGYNWQVGQLVLGVEAQFSWTNADGESICPNPAARCQTELESITTVAGRLGYASNNWLFYAKGGGAWVREEHFVRFPANNLLDETSGSYTRSGWMVGAGIEYGFAPNWSAKVEYNFLSLNSEDLTFRRIATGAFVENARIDQDLHIVKFGINYRFWGGGNY
jgi:outer membrane immunogenic protein